MKGTILFLSIALLFGCSKKEDTQPLQSEKPLVFVSIPPLAGLVKNISKDAFEVRTLVGEGQSPHSYEPTAKQLTTLSQADILFTIGVPFEQPLLKKIKPLYPALPIIETDARVKKRSMPHAHHGEHCTHDHGAKDPHVWLDPLQLEKIAEDLCHGLMELDPENAQLFHQNFETLTTGQLSKLDTKLMRHKGTRFYVFHPSFGYFADAYGLEQIAIELDGKSPSPRQLANLIEQAKTDGVKVIFVQKQFPEGSAKAVADAIGGKVVQLDPLAEDVIANLKQIAEAIVQTLEQEINHEIH